MSSTDSANENEIEYPETDGKPTGETDWHIHALIRLREILKRRYRDHHVYVGSDLLVYYDEGKPYHFVVPDVFVAFDCPPGPRRVFKTWEERRVPDVVLEITSRSSSSAAATRATRRIRLKASASCNGSSSRPRFTPRSGPGLRPAAGTSARGTSRGNADSAADRAGKSTSRTRRCGPASAADWRRASTYTG